MSTDNTLFADWCAKELQRTGARVVRELSGGNSNLTQLITTDQGPLVLRTPPANTISPKAHRGVERESIVMAALAGRIPVPGMVAWCDDPTINGRPFMLVEHIDGVSITEELPAAYDGVDSINSLGEQLIDALAGIATAPWQDIGLSTFGNPDNFLARQIERWLEVRRTAVVRELPEIESLGRWLLDNLPVDGPVGVVHGDFHLDNSLCSRDRAELLAVIDWEMATIGDPLTDLGLFLMFWGPRQVEPPGFPACAGGHPHRWRRQQARARRALGQANRYRYQPTELLPRLCLLATGRHRRRRLCPVHAGQGRHALCAWAGIRRAGTAGRSPIGNTGKLVMQATMMHTPMTVQMIMQHGQQVFPDSRVGTFDGNVIIHTPYADIANNATRLAGALSALGIVPGDRVGTFSWNNTAHMEAYLAIPSMGAIMHTVNIRLSPEHIAYVINHAQDKAIILDATLLAIFRPVMPLLDTVQQIIIIGGEADLEGFECHSYEALLAQQAARLRLA